MQLSGGFEAVAHRGVLIVRKVGGGCAERRAGALCRGASGQLSFRCAG